MSLTTKDIATALSLTPRAVLIRAKAEGWAFELNGRTKLFDAASLPGEVRTLVGLENKSDPPAQMISADVFSQVREQDRVMTLGRAALIGAYQDSGLSLTDFVAAFNSGLIPGCWDQFGLKTLKYKTFSARLLKYKEEGPQALIPQWSVKKTDAGPGQSLPDTAKEFLRSKYLVQNKPSANSCWVEMVKVFGDICHPSTVNRYLASLDQAATKFHRDGPTAWRDRMTPWIDRDPRAYSPMEQVQSDHHHFDFFISYRGNLERPWVTAMVDFATGKCLSAIPSMGPNASTIAMAYVKMGMEYGYPEEMHTDNGKDYLAQSLTGMKEKDLASRKEEEEASQIAARGLYQICGTRLILATPYSGRSKGRTERMFGAWAQYFSRRFPTYCGSNTVTKPEEANLLTRSMNKMPQRKIEGLDWEVYVAALEEFVRTWNSQWVGKMKGRVGQTADQAFAAKPHRSHKVDPALVEMNFGAPFRRTVQGCYVSIDNQLFYSRDLASMSGKKVIVKRLFHSPGEVVVLDTGGHIITRALAGQWSETEDLAQVRHRQGVDIKYLRQKARALKPDLAPSEPSWMPVAVGAEHKALTGESEPQTMRTAKTTKLINPLDAAFTKEN